MNLKWNGAFSSVSSSLKSSTKLSQNCTTFLKQCDNNRSKSKTHTLYSAPNLINPLKIKDSRLDERWFKMNMNIFKNWTCLDLGHCMQQLAYLRKIEWRQITPESREKFGSEKVCYFHTLTILACIFHAQTPCLYWSYDCIYPCFQWWKRKHLCPWNTEKTKCILVIVSGNSSSKVIQKYSIFYYTLYCHVFVLRKLLNPSQIRSNRVIVLACQ